jgi:peptide/nickel transport system substrate-binding protein
MLQDKDTEVIKLKILSGEIDWERRRGLIIDLPLYRENESKAGIDVVLTIKPEGSQQGIKFNPGHPDPDVRAVIDNADFRRALSIAIDRRVIQETGYLGLGKVGHGFSPPGVYNPEIDGAWAQHDPDRASKMLDSIGLNKRDSEGYRLLPNGKKFTFTLLFMPGWHAGHNETAEVATEGWRKVGIRAIAKPVDSRLLNATLWDSRQYEAWIDPWVGGLESQNLAYGTGLIRWANLQKQWWNNRNLPADKRPGIEPKGSLVKLLELEDTALSTSDPNEMQRAIDEHRRVMADQMWVIGIVQDLPHLLIVKKNLRNVWGRKKPIILGAGDEDYWPRSWYFDR